MFQCFHNIDSLIPENRFQYAVGIVLNHEGGFSDDKNDPGGMTNYGISQRFVDDEKLKLNIQHLTLDEAKDIYRKYWWDRYHYDAVNDLKLATKIFDLSVNLGPDKAHALVQKSLNHIQNEHIAIDGVFGPQTIAAVNQSDPIKLMTEFRLETRDYYINLVSHNPSLAKFEYGWLVRAAW